jgi:hypothetical protein
VRAYVGDATIGRDNIRVSVEGTTLVVPNTAANTFAVVSTASPVLVSADGRLDITVSDTGGDPYWVINGIDLWRSDQVTPPTEAPLRAAVTGQAGQPDAVSLGKLSYSQLASVVEQAVGIWAGTGLNAAQVALLRATPVAIANLDAQGYLGLTTPERIVIDDDGVGLGWTSDGQRTTDNGQRTSYDLLTTVLHELGHVLGQTDAADDDLMGAILQPGERHVPDVDSVFAGW